MFTLTDFVIAWRKFVPIFVISILMIFILIVVAKIISVSTVVAPRQVAEAFPTPAFGKLAAIKFESSVVPSTKLTYVLDTFAGVPETSTASAKVYFKPKKSPTFVAREKALLLAKGLGFAPDATRQIESVTARFADDVRTLDLDLQTENFAFARRVDDALNAKISNEPNEGLSEDDVRNAAVSFLREIGYYSDFHAKGTSRVVYLKHNTDQKKGVIIDSIDNANMFEVDFFPPQMEGVDVLSERVYSSPNHVVFVKSSDSGYTLVKMQVAVYENSLLQYGIYRLKSGTVAFDELRSGRGTITNPNSIGNLSEVKIKKMITAYVEPDRESQYLMPYYVFLGEDNFVALVNAIDGAYLTQ